MGSMERLLDRANARAAASVRAAGSEIRAARLDRNLSLADVGRAVGLSASEVSRIERACVPEVSILKVARLAEAVGLELSVRLFPGGSPIRDRAHLALLDRLRGTVSPDLRWAVEVPLAGPGDRRAWDAMIAGPGWRYGVEAETAPRDAQALARRVNLKQRDGLVDGVLLALPRTRRARIFLETAESVLQPAFPIPGADALARLRRGLEPGGSAIVLV